MNPQAEELNNMIRDNNPIIYNLLSEKGRAIFFPKKGILAQTAEAKGKRINATIGAAVENDGSPMRLPSLARMISLDPQDAFPYAPSFGKAELRKMWKEMIYKKNPSLKTDMSLPVVTNALTHGLSILGYMFVNPGDEIIITDKFWGNYKLIFENAYGGALVPFNTFTETGFDLESFRQKLTEVAGKQIITLNFPNNPAGYTPTRDEAQQMAAIILESAEKGNKIVVFIDDAYFGLVYKEGVYEESLFSLLADLHENVLAIKVDGATKEDYVWGFRVGFLTYACKGIAQETCEALEAKTSGAIRGNISNVSHLSQSLLLKAFSSPTYEQEKQSKYELLKSRYHAVRKVLEDDKFAEYFTPLPYNSGYFMCIELKEGLDGEQVRQVLLEKYDTGVISVGNMLRIAFSSVGERDVPELFENILQACKENF